MIKVYIDAWFTHFHMRSYHAESTLIHLNEEVKSQRASLVLSWGTRWEKLVTHVIRYFYIFFCVSLFSDYYFLIFSSFSEKSQIQHSTST